MLLVMSIVQVLLTTLGLGLQIEGLGKPRPPSTMGGVVVSLIIIILWMVAIIIHIKG